MRKGERERDMSWARSGRNREDEEERGEGQEIKKRSEIYHTRLCSTYTASLFQTLSKYSSSLFHRSSNMHLFYLFLYLISHDERHELRAFVINIIEKF